MSIFPVFNASFVGLLLVGLFLWNVWLLLPVFICLLTSIFLYVTDLSLFKYCHVSGFWLFIISEIAVFGSLLFCCLYFDYDYYTNLSSSLELPFLGCFILLGSSIIVTGYHHLIWWKLSWVLLLFTVVLGISFICLQIVEMEEIIMNIFDTTFHASSLCTIGLHFSHVFIGVIGLLVVLLYSVDILGFHRCSIIVWYWHFVDYVWLFVYTLVYIC